MCLCDAFPFQNGLKQVDGTRMLLVCAGEIVLFGQTMNNTAQKLR
jgi:hypothetical protein